MIQSQHFYGYVQNCHINLQPAGSSVNSDCFEHTSQFWLVVYEKMCFEAYTNDQYISQKNNIAQLYFILPEPSYIEHFQVDLEIPRFTTVHMVKTHLLLENLWTSAIILE